MNRTYKSWSEMKQRCDNPNRVDYHRYGGRGISYDPRWRLYVNFIADMGKRPIGLELDRIDNNGNYHKANCRWATRQQQVINRGLLKTNTSGINGIHRANNYWVAQVHQGGLQFILYKGKDLFEACCRRKAWDNKVHSGVFEATPVYSK